MYKRINEGESCISRPCTKTMHIFHDITTFTKKHYKDKLYTEITVLRNLRVCILNFYFFFLLCNRWTQFSTWQQFPPNTKQSTHNPLSWHRTNMKNFPMRPWCFVPTDRWKQEWKQEAPPVHSSVEKSYSQGIAVFGLQDLSLMQCYQTLNKLRLKWVFRCHESPPEQALCCT